MLLEVHAPADAIIHALNQSADVMGELEYLVDRRRLENVRVIERYAEISPEQYRQEAATIELPGIR